MTGARWALPLPFAVAVLAWVDALLGDDLGSGVVGVLAAAVAALVAGRFSRPVPLAAMGAAAALLLAVADQVAAPGQFSLANDGVFYGVLVGAPALAGWLLGDRARQLAQLRIRTDELARRRPAALRAARAEETQRVERELDGALAARLGRLVDGIHAAAGSPDRARDALAEIETVARGALGELRTVLGVLGGESADQVAATPTPRPRRSGVRLDLKDGLLALVGVPLAVESASAGPGPVVANVALALAQGGLLLVVRRRPLLGVAAVMLAATAQTALLAPVPPMVSWLLPGLLTTYLVGATSSWRAASLGLLTAVAGVLLVTAATPTASRELDSLVPSLVLGTLAWGAGRVVAARDRRARELTATAAELARTEDVERRLAAAEQRAELARELHDVGAHVLTVVCLQSGAAQVSWERDPAQATAALAALSQLADGTLDALRRSLADLATSDSSVLDAAALDVLAGLGRALGLRVEVDVRGAPRPLPDDVGRAAFRVVQESLTNVARHAARGSVRVGVHYRPASLEVCVTDDGPGQGPPTVPVNGAGLGLRGMRERVEACRGELDFGRSGDGFLVRALLPLGAHA